MNERDNEFDFFISHASEDKDVFVRPLAVQLENIGYRIWYDEFTLKVGDSLISELSKGIKKSHYGIIVLSRNFIRKGWTKKELEALLNKEVITNSNLILPIWLDITSKEVFDFSPFLIDKFAITVKLGEIDKTINEIEKISSIKRLKIETLEEKINYLINCNIDRRKKYYLDLENRIRSLFLFQEEFYNFYTSDINVLEEERDFYVSCKELDFLKEYKIPKGVWYLPEPFDWKDIERAIKLCKKWVFRKLTYKDAEELYFLLEEYLDSDISYILYDFPHSSISNKETRDFLIDSILKVGVLNVENRNINDEEHKRIMEITIGKYYS